jgi:hypothetical protein
MNWNEMRSKKRLEYLLDMLKPVPARDPKMAASGRAYFLEQARILQLSDTRKAEHHPNKGSDTISPLVRRRATTPVWNALIATVLAVVIFFGGTAATVYAAQDSLPGQTLYPIKTLSEDARLSLSDSPQRQLDLILSFTDRRIVEMVALHSAGKPIPQEVIERFQNESEAALTLVAKMKDADITQALDQTLLSAESELKAVTILVAGHPADPVLMAVEARLQEQVELVTKGKANSQNFRLEVGNRPQGSHGAPGNQQQGTNPEKPERTPMPDGNGNGSNPNDHRPAGTPGHN